MVMHRTNYAPSPQQVQEIKQILREPEKKLRALEEEIAQLQAQRDDLQSFIDNHRSLLSPIRRIHSDILREIFVQCLPEDHLPVRSLREAPLLLTGICRSWRGIVITTPGLWNRIHVSLPFPHIPPVTESFRSLMRIRTDGIKLWLDRAGGLPLSLSFYATMPIPMSTREHTWRWDQQNLHDLETLYLDFTQCLLAYSARWGSVSLTVPHCVREFFETYRFGSLDLLKSFRSAYSTHRYQGNAQARPWHGIFERANSLHILHLDEPHSDIPIPWGNLTELSLSASLGEHNITASEAVRLLSLCTSLHWCNLNIRLGSASHVAPATSPVVLPHLHSANFSFLSSPHNWNMNGTLTIAEMEPINLLFDAITAPALKCLSISIFSAAPIVAPISQPINTSPFLSFVERSGCALSNLVLNLPTVEDRLIGLLNLTPSLSAFTVVNHANRLLADPAATGLIGLLGALTPDSTPTDVLCPLLDEITLMHCIPEHAEPLLELAEARCGPSDVPGVVRLNKMFASFGTYLDGAEDVSCRLQALRDRGMTVRWSSPLDRRGQLQDDSPLRGFSRPPGIPTRDRMFISENPGRILNEHLY